MRENFVILMLFKKDEVLRFNGNNDRKLRIVYIFRFLQIVVFKVKEKKIESKSKLNNSVKCYKRN